MPMDGKGSEYLYTVDLTEWEDEAYDFGCTKIQCIPQIGVITRLSVSSSPSSIQEGLWLGHKSDQVENIVY